MYEQSCHPGFSLVASTRCTSFAGVNGIVSKILQRPGLTSHSTAGLYAARANRLSFVDFPTCYLPRQPRSALELPSPRHCSPPAYLGTETCTSDIAMCADTIH